MRIATAMNGDETEFPLAVTKISGRPVSGLFTPRITYTFTNPYRPDLPEVDVITDSAKSYVFNDWYWFTAIGDEDFEIKSVDELEGWAVLD